MNPEEIYNINIEEVKDFFSKEVKKNLQRASKEMKLTTLGDLFKLYETKEFMHYFIKMSPCYKGTIKDSYIELITVIKLLKYKYLGIDPQLNISDKLLSESPFKCLVEMGISRGVASDISKTLKEITTISELIELLCNEIFLEEELLIIENIGPTKIKEILVKAQIIKQYLEKRPLKNQSDSLIIDKKVITEKNYNTSLANSNATQKKDTTDQELRELYKQLEELLQRSQNLNEQIIVVRYKIEEIMNMEASNGSKRKK